MKITLENLHEATAQQVFNQVRDHLLSQMKQSKKTYRGGDADGATPQKCAYFGDNNLTCAAGCLIGDSIVAEKFDTFNVSDWKTLVYKLQLVPDAHTDLIADLQVIHDMTEPMFWQEQLISTAKEYDLVF